MGTQDLLTVIDRLAADLARATGQSEQCIRLAYGLPPRSPVTAAQREGHAA